jgi:hypothetical protein
MPIRGQGAVQEYLKIGAKTDAAFQFLWEKILKDKGC